MNVLTQFSIMRSFYHIWAKEEHVHYFPKETMESEETAHNMNNRISPLEESVLGSSDWILRSFLEDVQFLQKTTFKLNDEQVMKNMAFEIDIKITTPNSGTFMTNVVLRWTSTHLLLRQQLHSLYVLF